MSTKKMGRRPTPKPVIVPEPVITSVKPERVAHLASECLVELRLVESRKEGAFWLHEYEVKGEPGKVEKFLARLRDIEMR
ncbi:MAG TPA: hypothetical protein PKA28_06060 [Methylomusa anaerophila]|nr:hypothetical protein [Methylomusa anaerophila]HML87997.1 hypothetical protein [Methylomusa anaerophila]